MHHQVHIAGVVEKLLVYPERMQANLDASFGLVFSQPVLLALVNVALYFRRRYFRGESIQGDEQTEPVRS